MKNKNLINTKTKAMQYDTLLANIFSDYKIPFKIGDIVYLKTDPEQRERLVTGYYIRETSVTYLLSYETIESTHYDFEISKDKDIIKVTSN